MKAPEVVIEELLRRVREILYAHLPPRSWFTQQTRVKASLTLPAKFLDDRKVELPATRYAAILNGILDTIKRHCHNRRDLGPFPCAYLHHCIESHLRHHGDDYYNEGKSIRNVADRALSHIEKSRLGADSTVPILAQVHRALDIGKRKPKIKPNAAPLQPDFFPSSNPPQFAKLPAPSPNSTPKCETLPCAPRRRQRPL